MAGRSFGIVRACPISADCGPGPRYSARSDSIADCYQEALGTSGLRGSCWQASPLAEHLGIRKLDLQRRVRRSSLPDWYLVSVTEQLVGTLDDGSWDPKNSLLVSFSEWKTRQEVLLLVGRHGWLRGRLGSAVLTPGGPAGDWDVSRW